MKVFKQLKEMSFQELIIKVIALVIFVYFIGYAFGQLYGYISK